MRLFCTSRMQTASVPGAIKHSSTISSPKKWLLPDPRPPYAPLYLAGASSGRNMGAVGMRRVAIENPSKPIRPTNFQVLSAAVGC